jgi:hypothetical protein
MPIRYGAVIRVAVVVTALLVSPTESQTKPRDLSFDLKHLESKLR